MKVILSLQRRYHKKKPDKNQTRIISNTIAECKDIVDISEAADLIGNKGCTFCGATFKPSKRKKNCVEAMQLFAIDFDDGVTYKEVKAIIDRYNLPLCFSYHTFSSSKEQERFRIVFCFEFPILDAKFMKMIIRMLMEIFPMCDKSCRDECRMFFGGKRIIDDPLSYLTFNQLIHAYYLFLYSTDLVNASRRMSSICKICAINKTKDNTIDYKMNCKKEDLQDPDKYIVLCCPQTEFELNLSKNVYYFKKSTDPDAQNKPYAENGGTTSSDRGSIKQKKTQLKDNKIIFEKCRLAKEFFEGEHDCFSHDIRFKLLTNIIQFRGMRKSFLDAIDASGHDKVKWNADYKYAEANGYHAARCEDYCPYCDECQHGLSMYSTVVSGPNRCIRISEPAEYVDIETARSNLYQAINNCCQTIQYNSLIIINAQTGIGKSHAYCSVIAANPDMKFCVAAPTNKLKNQIAYMLQEHFRVPPSDIYVCPSIFEPGFPIDVAGEIQNLHSMGLHNAAKDVIMKKIQDAENEEGVVDPLREYLDQIDRTDFTERVLIVTHAKLRTLSAEVLRNRIVFIDEDILEEDCFHNVLEVNEESVRKALPLFKDWMQGRLKTMLDMPIKSYKRFEINNYQFLYNALNHAQMEEYGIEGNVNDLLNAISVHRTKDGFQYLVYSPLPPSKYIVMSATADEELYRKYYGNTGMNISSYVGEIGTVRYKGTLIQYNRQTLGRKSLDDEKSKIESFVAENYPEKYNLITFKKYDKDPINAENIKRSELYYGNLIGLNDLEGKNIIVMGTPFIHSDIYKLIAAALGADCNSEDFKDDLKMRRVEYNGYSFKTMTSKDPIIQAVELHSIFSQLEQAVGRARLLNHECTVLVFSGFPCSQAEIHEEEYLKKNDEGETEEDVQEADEIQADKPFENSKASNNRSIRISKFVSDPCEEETRNSPSFQPTPWAETPRPMCGIIMCNYLQRPMCGRIMCEIINPSA